VDNTEVNLLRTRVEQLERMLSGLNEVQVVDWFGNSFNVLGKQMGGPAYTGPGNVPFQVYTQAMGSGNTTDPATIQYGVPYNSQLQRSLTPNSTVTIEGLLTEENPDSADAGWFSMNSDGNIWLEINFDGGAVTTASIEHGTDFNLTLPAWRNGAYVENDGATNPTQTLARLLIATVESGNLTQVASPGNYVMRNICINGQAALYPLHA